MFVDALKRKVTADYFLWEKSVNRLQEVIREYLLPKQPKTLVTSHVRDYLVDPKNKPKIKELFEDTDVAILIQALDDAEKGTSSPQQGT